MAEKEPMNIGAIVNGFESPNIPQISQPNADNNIREIPHIDLTSSQEGRKKSIEGLITMADNNNSIPTTIDSHRNGSTRDIEYDSGKIEETFTISSIITHVLIFSLSSDICEKILFCTFRYQFFEPRRT